MSALPIAVSVGDPAGVGPRVCLEAAVALRDRLTSAIFGDAAQLWSLVGALGLDEGAFVDCDEDRLGSVPRRGIAIVDCGRVPQAAIDLHAASVEGGAAQLAALARAADCVRQGRARALATGPTSKAAIVLSGHPFVGQTEFLAHRDGLADDAVTMLFLGPRLRVGLVSTHLAVADVPRAITGPRVMRTALHLGEALVRLCPDRVPTLAVSGLNPHADEGGLFGREELEVIAPAMTALAGHALFREGKVKLSGPTPAEAVFRAAERGTIDGVVAMFHDQATIASKLLDWGAAVNTTWGLSFLRTSVDHGVAYDAAMSGRVDADGMCAALSLAHRLTTESDA